MCDKKYSYTRLSCGNNKRVNYPHILFLLFASRQNFIGQKVEKFSEEINCLSRI